MMFVSEKYKSTSKHFNQFQFFLLHDEIIYWIKFIIHFTGLYNIGFDFTLVKHLYNLRSSLPRDLKHESKNSSVTSSRTAGFHLGDWSLSISTSREKCFQLCFY